MNYIMGSKYGAFLTIQIENSPTACYTVTKYDDPTNNSDSYNYQDVGISMSKNSDWKKEHKNLL